MGKPESRSDKAEGHLFLRCGNKKCRCYHNVLKFTPFKGKSKLTLRQIGYAVKTYINYDQPAPATSTVAGQLLVGRRSVQKVFDVLRAKEAEVCQVENEKGSLVGDVEGDGHVLRNFHVSLENPHFAAQLSKKPKLKKGAPHYYLSHVRVAAVKTRGQQKAYLRVLPYKLVAPGARPPPEGKEELIASKLFDRISGKAKNLCHRSVLHTDGAAGWPSAARVCRPGIKSLDQG